MALLVVTPLSQLEPTLDQSMPILGAKILRRESSSPVPWSFSSSTPHHSHQPSFSSGESSERNENNNALKMPSPVFLLYSDSEIGDNAARPKMSQELVNRLVRNTISNMTALCQNLKSAREPTKNTLEEMAKALCKR